MEPSPRHRPPRKGAGASSRPGTSGRASASPSSNAGGGATTRTMEDDMRATLGSRAGRIDAARSRLSSAGNPAMYTGGRHWGKRIGAPPSTAPKGSQDEATTVAFGHVLHDNPHHATTLFRPAMLRRVTSTKTPFDNPVGFSNSSKQRVESNDGRDHAAIPRAKGKHLKEEAARLSGWIDSLKGKHPPRADSRSSRGGSPFPPPSPGRELSSPSPSPSPSGLGFDDEAAENHHHHHHHESHHGGGGDDSVGVFYGDARRPSTSLASLVNVLASHDALFGTWGSLAVLNGRPEPETFGPPRGAAGSRKEQRRHDDFGGYPGLGAGAGAHGGRVATPGYGSGDGDGDGDGVVGKRTATPHLTRAYSPASSSLSASSHGGGGARRASARGVGGGGHKLQSEADAAAAAAAAAALEKWTRFILKLTARRDHAIKLALDGFERRSSRRPLGGLRASLEQTVQLARVAALYEDSYARMAVAAAGGVDVLVAGEGSKLSDAVGVSTRAGHEAAERSRAKHRRGATVVVEADGTVKHFNKEGKAMAAAADEGRSQERLDIVTHSMVRREAFAMIPKARRDWLIGKGVLPRGGIQPRDRLQEETQRLVDAHELREERARGARTAAAAARKQSWESVIRGNREKKAAREVKKAQSFSYSSGRSGSASPPPAAAAKGARTHGGSRGGSGRETVMSTNRPVFFGSLAGSQLVHELIDFALRASSKATFGGGGVSAHSLVQPGAAAGAATREAHERLTQSRTNVVGSMAAVAAAAPDDVILGVPGTVAVLEEARALRAMTLAAGGGVTRGEESFLSKATSDDRDHADDDDLDGDEGAKADAAHGRRPLSSGGRIAGSAPPRGRPSPVRPASTAEVAAEFAYFLRSNEEDVRDSFAAVLGGGGSGGGAGDDGGDDGDDDDAGTTRRSGNRPGTSGSGGFVSGASPLAGGTPGEGGAHLSRVGLTGGDSSAWGRRVGSARGAQDREWAALHHANALGRDGSLYGHRLSAARPPSPTVWKSPGGGGEGKGNRGSVLYEGLCSSGAGKDALATAMSGVAVGSGEGGDGRRPGVRSISPGGGRDEDDDDISPGEEKGEALEASEGVEGGGEVDPAAAAAAAAAAASARASLRWRASCGQVLLARWRHRNLVRHAATATPDDRMYFKHFSRRLSRATSTLDLTATAFGLRHAALLGPFLQVHVGVVRRLSLSRNPLAPRATAIAAAAVQLAAGTVSRLDLAGCGLSPTHVPRLQSLLLPSAGPAAGGLTELVLSDNPLGDVGFSGLAACLCGEYSGFSALRRLEVSGCGLGVVAANAIGGVLRMNHTLEELDASRNTFGPTGAAHIAGGLAENDRLAVLDLTSCQIGGLGAAVIARALLPEGGGGFEAALAGAGAGNGAALRVLEAAGGGAWSNRAAHGTGVGTSDAVTNGLKLVGDLAAVAQLHEATGNTALRELWLGDNNADSRCVFGLLAAMAVHPALNVLELRSNPLGPAAARRLLRAFRAKPRFARLGLAGVALTVHKVKGPADQIALGAGAGASNYMCGWEHFDEGNPSGLTYQMRLSDPFGRQMAVELCREWWNRAGHSGTGREVWRECFIERSEGGVKAGTVLGKEGQRALKGLKKAEPFTLGAFHDWPARLPDLGDLTVTLTPRAAEDYPAPAERAAEGVMSAAQFEAAWDGVIVDATQLGAVGATAASATSAWRLDYARVLGDAVWLTPGQASRVVDSFDWPADRVDILAKLFPRLVDTADFSGVMSLAAAVGPATWRGAMRRLGLHRLVCEDNPSGAYNLNLSAPLDRFAAAWLREDAIAASKRHPGRYGWRNVRMNGAWVAEEGVSRALGTAQHRALRAWKLPARGVLAFDHAGAPLPPTRNHRGTLSPAAAMFLEAKLRSPPPYPPAARVLAAAAAFAEEVARGKAARAEAREARRRVAEIEASKARAQGKEVAADVQAVLDEVEVDDEEGEEEEEEDGDAADDEGGRGGGKSEGVGPGARWVALRDDAEVGEMVRDKLRRTMQIADMEKAEAEEKERSATRDIHGIPETDETVKETEEEKTADVDQGKESRRAQSESSSSKKLTRKSSKKVAARDSSRDDTSDDADDAKRSLSSSTNPVQQSADDEKKTTVGDGVAAAAAAAAAAAEEEQAGESRGRILTAEETTTAKLILLRAIADDHRPTARQAVTLLKASGLLRWEDPARENSAGAVGIVGGASSSSVGGLYAGAVNADGDGGSAARATPPSKWPPPESSSLRSGMSHVASSTDASWGPPEPQPSQLWRQAGCSSASVAAAAAAVGFYARLAYPPHVEPRCTFAKVLEHTPRSVQLEIHDRLGSSASVPINVVTGREGLAFRLRMSDAVDASVARRLARLRVKAGADGAMTQITIDGKPAKDIDDTKPNLWIRLWTRSQGRAVIEFQLVCSERGLTHACVATIQSLWKRHLARRRVWRLKFCVTVLAPRIGRRWVARARATIAAKRQAALEHAREMKRRAAKNVSAAFGDGNLERAQGATLFEAALAEDDQAVLAVEKRGQRNWGAGVRLGHAEMKAKKMDYHTSSSASSSPVGDDDDDVEDA